jgi:NCAIR mutase (PurE)-related protein
VQVEATTRMDSKLLLTLFRQIATGGLSPEQALAQAQRAGFEDLGFAKLDHQRAQRLGFPEVVFAEGKRIAHLLEICRKHLEAHERLLVTRLSAEHAERILAECPGGHYNPTARTLSYGLAGATERGGVLVVCAGTADLPVAEEAFETARLMGNRTELIADVGVAGLHRLLAHKARLEQARVLIVVAGMEGALPSVVGGLVGAPLIAVPTSVGYGAGLGGVAALLAMLNSCAPGVTVVNIDNGFGAAFAASVINQLPAAE